MNLQLKFKVNISVSGLIIVLAQIEAYLHAYKQTGTTNVTFVNGFLITSDIKLMPLNKCIHT